MCDEPLQPRLCRNHRLHRRSTTPESVAHFQPSKAAQERVATLLKRQAEDVLSPDEEAELDHFMDLEHILRMAKARARQILASGQ